MISLILVIFAACCNAVMDTLQFKYSSSVFKRLNPYFWNPEVSWRNKYKNADPTKGAAFFGSTTFFVLFTDAWHLSQSLFLFCILSAVPFYTPILSIILDLILFNVVFRFVFEIIHRTISKTK